MFFDATTLNFFAKLAKFRDTLPSSLIFFVPLSLIFQIKTIQNFIEKMMTANEVRESYKKFFEGKGHKIVASAPMVIKDDPTLMFTNAGMNQWKDIILGTKDPGKDIRRVDSQKCLRVSGKHNDLEEVGHDTYHHTMFEMLGNWSFGDYFKEGAIDYAWEYLVDVLHLNPDDLYVTVFEGAKEEDSHAMTRRLAIGPSMFGRSHHRWQ